MSEPEIDPVDRLIEEMMPVLHPRHDTEGVRALLRERIMAYAAEREAAALAKASQDLHELRCLLYQDGWIGTGTPQAALAWRLDNHAAAKQEVAKLKAERDAAIKARDEADNPSDASELPAEGR